MGNQRGLGFHLIFISVFFSATTYSCLGVRNTSVVCFEEERLALLKFKESVQDDFGMLSSWVGNDCCRWGRIKCNSVTGHVESLHLRGDSEVELFLLKRFYLVGNEVSSSLAYLSHLKYLDMSGNYFQGSRIPKFIGSLEQLTYLNLSNGDFQGIIPHHIGNLSNLEVLDLSLNRELMIDDIAWTFGLTSLKHLDFSFLDLIGQKHVNMVLYMIPSLEELSLHACELHFSDLGRPFLNSSIILPNIKHLDLGFNYFKGPLPCFLQNMTSLTFLDLSNLSLSWKFADLLKLIPSVSELHLSGCGLYNTHLSSPNLNFSTLSNIQHLDLSMNWIEGVFPSVLTNMSSLGVLDLRTNMLNSSVPIMPNLIELDLSNNKFKQIEHVGIQRQCHLRKLYAAENLFDVEMIDSLKNASECSEYALEMLDLSGSLYGTFPKPLGRLTNLRELDMSSCKLTGPIPETLTRLRLLEVLDLSDNGLTGSIPESITSLRYLEVLHLSKNRLSGPIPTFLGSLYDLDLSFNQLSGSIPESLGRLVSLQTLSLSSNRLHGTMQVSISQLAKLHSLDLSNNFLEGVASEAYFTKLLMLRHLDISSNTRLTFNVSHMWKPPFQLVSLGSCNIGSELPQWLQNQRKLLKLTMSNAAITGPLPIWLRKMHIKFLDLSNNTLVGPLTNLPNGGKFDVPGYGFYPSLYLEDNLFNESIPKSLCRRTNLVVLDLSRNRLTGKIPKCLVNLQKLRAMRFSSNNLSGVIPRFISHFSSSLLGLKLNDNKFSGELPRELGDLHGLEFLDLSDNEFVGYIPESIAEKFGYLMVLRLRGNNFMGSIPQSVCNITRLQILDIAYNNLTGTIPRCLGRLHAMVYHSLYLYYGTEEYDEENVNQLVKGVDRVYAKSWQIVFNMDLSSNKLVGGIPVELTALSMLMGLNLSNNHLSGRIPGNIGNMTKLESLDFSNNELTGIIPPSMAALNFLSHLNLSHNNLSGQIPTGRQLQTLDDPSIYVGNKDLCGPPLSKNCSSHEDPTTTRKKNKAPDKLMRILFYVDIMCGFATGFWGIIGVLLFKKQWRQNLFMFAEETMDKIYVVVVVRVAKMKRGREAA